MSDQSITDLAVWSGLDGYQLGVTRMPTFQTSEPTKVLVRAIGATDLPEAWSDAI